MRHLDLFSGIGGFALAASWVWGAEHEIVSFCEIEPYAQKVLKKHWPDVPCHDDIKTLRGNNFGTVDLLTGGFPCQPFSVAGKQGGKDDDRYLWPEMFRVIQEAKPDWVIGENVTNLDGLGLEETIFDLESIGYEVAPSLEIPACAIGADHQRFRVWVIAHSKRGKQPWAKSCNGENRRVGRFEQPVPGDRNWESALCEFRRVDDGLSYGVDRLDGIRNAIVPQVVVPIMQAIKEIQCKPSKEALSRSAPTPAPESTPHI